MKMLYSIALSLLLSLNFSACKPSATSETTDSEKEVVSSEKAVPNPLTQEETAEPETEPSSTINIPATKENTLAQKVVSKTPNNNKPEKKSSVQPENTVAAAPVEQKETESSVTTSEKEPVAVTAQEVKAETMENQTAEPDPVVAEQSAAPDHSNWNVLLGKYVNGKGDVNYAGFKADKVKLQSYLDELSQNPPQSSWSRNEKMAFWINAYNAYTIKLIVDNYPVSSITKLKGGKPWDDKWIKIGGETYSLNNIENDILRPQYKDPRIHFAVNCAAESCPPLLNKAWTADKLNTYFNQQAKSFINDPAYNKISANKVQISKIFDWYKEDFDDRIAYLNKYSNTKINPGAKLEFLEYDWALNKQ